MSRGDRKAIIVRDRPDLSLSRQCRLLSIARSSVYYAAKGESPANLALMRRIDELFLKYPFYGSRQMARQLRREGIHAGRHRVRRPFLPVAFLCQFDLLSPLIPLYRQRGFGCEGCRTPTASNRKDSRCRRIVASTETPSAL